MTRLERCLQMSCDENYPPLDSELLAAAREDIREAAERAYRQGVEDVILAMRDRLSSGPLSSVLQVIEKDIRQRLARIGKGNGNV